MTVSMHIFTRLSAQESGCSKVDWQIKRRQFLDALFMQSPQGVARSLQKVVAYRHAIPVSCTAPPPPIILGDMQAPAAAMPACAGV